MACQLLEFVTVTPLDAIQTAHNRRQVRSHAARVAATDALDHEAVQKPPRRRGRRQHLTWSLQIRRDDDDHNGVDALKRRPSGDNGLRTSLSGTSLIPAAKSPVYHEPFVSVVIQNYLRHLAVAIPEIDGVGRSALLRTSWFPMVINSPILFQVIVLFSASHYAAHRKDAAIAQAILSLKQCALNGIIHALSTSNEIVHDELIAATAKMASYEAIWGDEGAYHCHMSGVEDMLRLRGGLHSLGLDGFLSRLLIFIDTNSAFLLKTHLHLQESSFPRLEPFILPNPSRFIGEVE